MKNQFTHSRIFMGLLLAFMLILFAGVYAQEHPEHPTKENAKQEHPAKGSETKAEHPTSETQKITKESLAEAIENYVNREAGLKGGYFLFFDAQENKPLALKLDKVHKERLAKISDDTYFACADFKNIDGTMYDLDIFMKGHSLADLKVTQITLHKKAGIPRYTWYEEGGVWKQKPVK